MPIWKRVSAAIVFVLLMLDTHPAFSPADLANPNAWVTAASAGQQVPERFQMRRVQHRPSPSLSARRSVVPIISLNSIISTASYYNDYPASCDGHPVPRNVKFWTAYAAPFGKPLPCGTKIKVTLVDNPSRSVDVVILDRGPCRGWEYGRSKRCVRPVRDGRFWRRFDLSKAAYTELAPLSTGVLVVHWQILR